MAKSSCSMVERRRWRDLGLGRFLPHVPEEAKTVLDLTMKMRGEKAEYRGMTYPYGMSAFYRIDRNPHGPSLQPIITVVDLLAKRLDSEAGEFLQFGDDRKMGLLMIGFFTNEIRFNLGEYEGDTRPQAVKL